MKVETFLLRNSEHGRWIPPDGLVYYWVQSKRKNCIVLWKFTGTFKLKNRWTPTRVATELYMFPILHSQPSLSQNGPYINRNYTVKALVISHSWNLWWISTPLLSILYLEAIGSAKTMWSSTKQLFNYVPAHQTVAATLCGSCKQSKRKTKNVKHCEVNEEGEQDRENNHKINSMIVNIKHTVVPD